MTPITWTIADGHGRLTSGTTEPDPNRGDPFGAVADEACDMAQRYADALGTPVAFYAQHGSSSHSGTCYPGPRHPFTAYGVRMVTP